MNKCKFNQNIVKYKIHYFTSRQKNNNNKIIMIVFFNKIKINFLENHYE